MTNCKYKLRKLSVGLVSVGTMLIASTVLGQEVSASTETSASTTTNTTSADATATTSVTAASEAGSGASSGATVATTTTTNGGSQSTPAATETTPQHQSQTAVATSSSSSNVNASFSETQAPKAATTSPSTPAAASSNGGNQEASAETEPQTMDVERYTVDKENSKLNIKDGDKSKNGSSVTKDTKLIRNRDGEQRDIVDVTRTVKTNEDGTIDVTVSVMPKEIDKGAEVIALLDVSQKMTESDFQTAKENIKKLVTTLTSKSTDNTPNYNSRNSVRLISFYRKVNDPISLTTENVDTELDKVWQGAKNDWNWGVDLQGAIHKAREIFNKEKGSGKRQHIVLFSQGEATFSYDVLDKAKVSKKEVTEPVTSSNPLLPWPFYFDTTTKKHNVVEDAQQLIGFFSKMGITQFDKALEGVASNGNTLLNLGSSLFGIKNPLDYITMADLDTSNLKQTDFDYSNKVGEGYNFRSYSDRTVDSVGMKTIIAAKIKENLEKLQPKNASKWLGYLGLNTARKTIQVWMIDKALDNLFYRRQYQFYNHNLSAQAEAKMAQEEGITFYSVDVTSPEQAATTKRSKRSAHKTEAEKRNEKFDKYLKAMSDSQDFLKCVEDKDKFKDILEEVTVTETFEDKVTVAEPSQYKDSNGGKQSVKHTSSSWFFSSTKESLTWTISKDQLKKAFEDGKPLTLTYKLKVDNDKLKKSLEQEKERAKRSAPTENENSVTEKIISNTITYKINQKKGNDKSLDNVNLTYSKFKVPVPQIDGQVIEPQAPTLPELPPVTEHGPVLDYTEESIYRLPLEHGSNAPDTQVTIEEDTVPQRPDILVGGQSGPVDITEDTQPSVSGSNDATVVEEDTAPKRPDVLVGGQSDPIDITEDTQPGMSGSNDATVIEEDTKPKRFFHFDNEPQAPEKPKEQPSLQDSNSLPQAPVYKAAHHLPASGDKREVFFTIAALTIIGAAGLLSKKRRDTEEN